jgi:hypothetical protein
VLHDRAPLPLPGISAVLLPGPDLDTAVLDLAAVLAGLVGDRFELLLVAGTDTGAPDVSDLFARAPGLPLRVVEGETTAAGCEAATFDLLFLAAPDGDFDVRELNHLLEEIEKGADLAAGYRPRRGDSLVRQLHRWGWKIDVDCAYELIRREVWQRLQQDDRLTSCCSELLSNARRLGFQVSEVRVSHRRPTLGAPVSSAA